MENPALRQTDHFEVINPAPQQHDFYLLYFNERIPLEERLFRIVKRSIDLLFSLVLLVFLIWWLPLIALLIIIDSKGPVFFFQKRHKKDGDLFTCIKFRTMLVNHQANSLPAADNDQRVTRLGKFLRARHLDELPQLINVLAGDMSLVGPRPYMICEDEKYEAIIKTYSLRYKVKPGITGLAQLITYSSVEEKTHRIEESISKDIFYIYNWSPTLDFKVMFRTILKMAGIKHQT